MASPTISASPDRKIPASIREMFDRIAPTYDTLNHLLSFGMDIRWRRRAVHLLEEKQGGVFLDLAAGSGDVSIELLKLRPRQVVATDFAIGMLDVLRKKVEHANRSEMIRCAACDAHSLPFRDRTFDATIVAFGIRNFTNRLIALREMHRVLKSSGLAVILELSRPTRPIVKQCYSLYAGAFLPFVGKIISRHDSAYRYLPESIVAFPSADDFLSTMIKANFVNVQAEPLTFGAATIFIGRKP